MKNTGLKIYDARKYLSLYFLYGDGARNSISVGNLYRQMRESGETLTESSHRSLILEMEREDLIESGFDSFGNNQRRKMVRITLSGHQLLSHITCFYEKHRPKNL